MNKSPILEMFNNLVGRWKIDRTLEGEGILNGRATFKGYAEYTLVEKGVILYREDGALSSEGVEQEGYRQYYYTYDSEKDRITKWFDWGVERENRKLFHELCFSEDFSKAYGDHPCGEDFYKVRYEFKDGAIHSMSYESRSTENQKSARQKNYVIKTVFSPESA